MDKTYYWDEFTADIQANVSSGSIVLDAGAGDCHWKTIFSPDVKYLGMDLGVGDENCDYSMLNIQGDLREIPLESESIDAIICIQVLEHLPEPWKVIAEFSRILKPGGKLFLSCPQGAEQHQVPYDFFRYTPFGLKSLLETNNFEIKWIKPQLGNFNRISYDFVQSVRRLPDIADNSFGKLGLSLLSLYLRILWRLHKPFLLRLDRFEAFQDNTAGHFVFASKM